MWEIVSNVYSLAKRKCRIQMDSVRTLPKTPLESTKGGGRENLSF
jgi:hypothetical protein